MRTGPSKWWHRHRRRPPGRRRGRPLSARRRRAAAHRAAGGAVGPKRARPVRPGGRQLRRAVAPGSDSPCAPTLASSCGPPGASQDRPGSSRPWHRAGAAAQTAALDPRSQGRRPPRGGHWRRTAIRHAPPRRHRRARLAHVGPPAAAGVRPGGRPWRRQRSEETSPRTPPRGWPLAARVRVAAAAVPAPNRVRWRSRPPFKQAFRHFGMLEGS